MFGQRYHGYRRPMVVICLMVMIIVLLVACGDNSREVEEGAKPSYQRISPEDARKRLDSEDGIVVLDVRTEEEYRQRHIPYSVLIPLDILAQHVETEISDKETVIFIYCRSGNRSKIAAKLLLDLGYTQVYDLGGINGWPYETETG